jgi:hypothetical protein
MLNAMSRRCRFSPPGMTAALYCLAAAAQGYSAPPALRPETVEVDISALAASERAALVPLLRAARQIDSLYIQQVWPGTPALIIERRRTESATTRPELDALNFFKGPWGSDGQAFIAGVPAERPIGDFYP